MKTKFVVISDTHYSTAISSIQLPPADVLIHCGDFTFQGKEKELINVNECLREVYDKYEHIIFIPGNHDFRFEEDMVDACNILWCATILHDRDIVINGLKVYGSAWTPEFHNWAFNLPRGKELADKWAMIPDDTDVLITHGPPEGILDRTAEGLEVGCQDLLTRVTQVKPIAHLFGHIHEGYGSVTKNGIEFINASSLDERYSLVNKPVVFEIDSETKQLSYL